VLLDAQGFLHSIQMTVEPARFRSVVVTLAVDMLRVEVTADYRACESTLVNGKSYRVREPIFNGPNLVF
jgi:hypothetical protein